MTKKQIALLVVMFPLYLIGGITGFIFTGCYAGFRVVVEAVADVANDW